MLGKEGNNYEMARSQASEDSPLNSPTASDLEAQQQQLSTVRWASKFWITASAVLAVVSIVLVAALFEHKSNTGSVLVSRISNALLA